MPTHLSTDALRALLIDVLADVAPDAEPAGLDPTEDVRDALDLDVADEHALATRLGDRLGIDIPSRDHARLHTLDEATSYLARRLGQPRDVRA